MRCSRSVRYAPGGPNLPTGGQAWPSVRPAAQPVHKGTGQCERPGRPPPVADTLHGGGGRWWPQVVRGGRPPGPRLSAQPCSQEASQREPSCSVWIRKRDAEGQGPGRPWAGVAEGAAGTAAVLWFRVEIVRGRRRRHAVLEAAAPSGFRGKRGVNSLFCSRAGGDGRVRCSGPRSRVGAPPMPPSLRETFMARPLP